MADPFLQAASNAIASGVSAPVDMLAWALRKAKLPIPSNPVGGSKWMEEKGLTAPVKQGLPQVLGETAGSLVDPLAPISKAALLAGALRKNLRMGHVMDLDYLPSNVEKLKELYNPSFAINDKPNLTQKFGDTVLVPQRGKFDPKTSNSTLYSTDVGTPEWHGQMPTKVPYRGWGRPAGFKGEDVGLDPLTAQENAARRLADRTAKDMDKYYSRGAPKHQTYSSFKELDKKGLPESTDYAELKAWGSQGLHKDNFAGLVLPQAKADDLNAKMLVEYLKKKGIPARYYQDPNEIGALIDALQDTR